MGRRIVLPSRSGLWQLLAIVLCCVRAQPAATTAYRECNRQRAGAGATTALRQPLGRLLLALRGGEADGAGETDRKLGDRDHSTAHVQIENSMADAMADQMADEMADEGADEEEESHNPVRDLIDEGCTAWDEENNFDLAEKAFQQALALDPINPDALCSMGVLLTESGGDLKKAAEHFARSIEHSPEHIDSLHYYGNLLYAQHDDNAAELMYKRAVQVIEKDGQDDGQDGLPSFVPFFDRKEDVHPLYVDTLCNHGALLERVRHDIDGAQALYDKTLAFDPLHRSVLFNYGVLLEDARKDYAAAEAMYRKALEQVCLSHLMLHRHRCSHHFCSLHHHAQKQGREQQQLHSIN